MATTKDSAATPELRARLKQFVGAWRHGHRDAWNPAIAIELHDEIERIATQAESEGAEHVAGPALELVVYLCSFVEGVAPNPRQREALAAMIERLNVAAGGVPAAKSAPPRPGTRVVIYLVEPEREIAGLAGQLGRQGCVVRPCPDLVHALAAIEQQRVDAVLVDGGLVEALPPVLSALERARPEVAVRATTLVVGAALDGSVRRYAARAGAEATFESGDPVAIAARLDELFAQRRALDHRVLVVEDDHSQALYASAILRHRGIATRVVARAADVPGAIASFAPDLVLLDLYLPDGNGIEVAQLLREHAEHAFLPIVFLSGEQDLDRRFDAIRMGGDDFVQKPVRPRHLIATVEGRIRLARERAARLPGRIAQGERRGTLVGRAPFLAELGRAMDADGGADAVTAVVLIAPHEPAKLEARAGFVGAGTFAQQLGVALSAEDELVRPACASGAAEFMALARAESEGVLRQRLTQLHRRLESRRWVAADDGVEVELQLAAVRVRAGQAPDAVVARLRTIAALARSAGGGRIAYDNARVAEEAEDPRRTIARALVRGPLPVAAVRVAMLHVQAIAGALAHQSVLRLAIEAPRASEPVVLERAEWIELARRERTLERAERELLKHALRAVAPMMRADTDARVHLDVTAESVLDSAFAPWLAAELRAIALAPSQLVCVVPVHDLVAGGKASREALDRLQIAGVRICLGGVEGGAEELKLVRYASVDAVRIAAGRQGARVDDAHRKLVDEARAHGKLVVLAGPIALAEVGELLKLGIHYVVSDVLAGWTVVRYPTPTP